MLPPDVKVIKQTQDAKFVLGQNTATPTIKVTFTVGSHGPFTETFDKDQFTADARDQALTNFANQVRTS